jgi:aspartyl protease family protein
MNDLPGWLKPVTVWSLAGVALFVGVRAWQTHQEATRFVIDGGTVEIRRSGDGHYHWRGQINGRDVEFLVDTGATGTAIPMALARELALPVVGSMQSNTAGGVVNGSVVLADLVLQGGLRADRLKLTALPSLGSPLLGMDVLGRLHWQQAGGVMRVELQGASR